MEQSLQALNAQNKMAEWAAKISTCRGSGLSVKRWCKENGICEQTYYKWQRRLFAVAKAQQEPQFAEIPTQKSRNNAAVAPVATIRINGYEADLYADADIHFIEGLCRVLTQC